MNCFTHDRSAAVGICCVCQKAICRQCIAFEKPRLVCQDCAQRRFVMGFDYRSSIAIGGWPLIHISAGIDPVTLRPRVAKGIIAIGNIGVGVIAIAGVAVGLFTLGGMSLGLLLAIGGMAVGAGLSLGGLAVGSIAIGGLAIGFFHAIGGAAFGPSVISGRHCDRATFEFIRQWLGSVTVPPNCR